MLLDNLTNLPTYHLSPRIPVYPDTRSTGTSFYKAPVGSRIRLVCNATYWSNDQVSLVLWYKGSINSKSSPIYTVDARHKPLNEARHYVSDSYKDRARFDTRLNPPQLEIDTIEEEDQSEYRCRVDYYSKPKENFLIILFVIGKFW